jgi:hypothetical protein
MNLIPFISKKPGANHYVCACAYVGIVVVQLQLTTTSLTPRFRTRKESPQTNSISSFPGSSLKLSCPQQQQQHDDAAKTKIKQHVFVETTRNGWDETCNPHYFLHSNSALIGFTLIRYVMCYWFIGQCPLLVLFSSY